ncbi:Hypp7407 [Branchiostoma lanceolatum]|uniref:Hypp7407 protein n=1 Tax=Branchiostoma lanceolatum TaxID=7740 RepID=A0A8J9YZZ8_BRALA|nr:Hypp7407 [Branchiostoma lanceolatum]
MFVQRVSDKFGPGFRQDGQPELPDYSRCRYHPPSCITEQYGKDNLSWQQTTFSPEGWSCQPTAFSPVGSDFSCNGADLDRWRHPEVLPTIVETRSITVEEFDGMSAGVKRGPAYDTNHEPTLQGNFAFFAHDARRWGFGVGMQSSIHHVSGETTGETFQNAFYTSPHGLPYQSQNEDKHSSAYIYNHDDKTYQPVTGALHALYKAQERFHHTQSQQNTGRKNKCSMGNRKNEEQYATYVEKKVRTKRQAPDPVSQVIRNAEKMWHEKCTGASQVHSLNDSSSSMEKTQQQQVTTQDHRDNGTRDVKQDGGGTVSVRLPPKKRRRLDDIVMRLKGSTY